MRRWLPLLGMTMFAGALVACGGGGGDGAGTGNRVTDPAKVQTSTPIANAVLFTVLQDGSISAQGLPDPATPKPGTPIAGGTNTTSGAKTHTVAAGDLCSTVAAQYNVSVDDLLKANRFIDSNCSNLKIGDILKIPSAATPVATARPGASTTAGGGTYTVVAGDSCSSIAAAKNVTVADLMSLNPSINANCTNLNAGQVLKLP